MSDETNRSWRPNTVHTIATRYRRSPRIPSSGQTDLARRGPERADPGKARSALPSRHQASPLRDPWVVARDESGPRYFGVRCSPGCETHGEPSRLGPSVEFKLPLMTS
jgi:hypothetical protein